MRDTTWIKAAVLRELNTPLSIEALQLPGELLVGQVLVDVRTSSICGAQLGEISGAKGTDPYLPHLLGHEGAGIVEACGPGVTQVKPGDHVVMHWRKGKGLNAEPPRYWRDGEAVGGGWITTFNTGAIVSENRLTAIDPNVPFDIAALMGCAVTTGFGIVTKEAKLLPGQSLLVAGCGGVGLNVIQAAKMLGAHVTAVDLSLSRRVMASRFGAYSVMERMPDWRDSKFDVFVDCTGASSVIESGIYSAHKTILVGQPRADSQFFFHHPRELYSGKIIMDSQGGSTDPNGDIPRYLSAYMNGDLVDLDSLITHRFKLDEINTALDMMREGITGKCILEMN